jgi:phosphoribosyl-ATP pyrophosphohydrolase/phosphoribosyl-AMP cyclohydrolase
MSWLDQLSFDADGLLPVVAQDAVSGDVLMLAYADREALDRTMHTGVAHYWSRSRGEIWEKGATSGNRQEVLGVRVDCDADAVLYLVRPAGPACHTLERSCFHRAPGEDGLRPAPLAGSILSRVEEVVRRRDEERPAGSYTTYLFEQGLDKALKKVGEEATETILAAKNGDADELRAEVADLIFHLLVVMRMEGLSLRAVREEMDGRFGGPTRVPPAGREAHPHS